MSAVKNILITGADGQLGQELQLLLKNKEYNVIAVNKAALDVSNKQTVTDFFEKNAVDIIINCAAYTAVDKAEGEVEKCYSINEEGAENLAEICKKTNAILIHISTDFVFDGSASKPIQETEHTHPLSIYGKSKLAGEQAIAASGCKFIIIRTSWLYSSFGANFAKTILRLAKDRDSLGIVCDQIGSPTYAADLAAAIEKFIFNPKSEELTGIYHFSNSGVASWYDFAVAIKNIRELSVSIKPIETFEYPTPAVRPSYSVLNCRKIKQTLEMEIPHWQESLTKCLSKIEN
jgi:dTDP-4-dehydrorhamnose reductase